MKFDDIKINFEDVKESLEEVGIEILDETYADGLIHVTDENGCEYVLQQNFNIFDDFHSPYEMNVVEDDYQNNIMEQSQYSLSKGECHKHNKSDEYNLVHLTKKTVVFNKNYAINAA